MMTESQVPAQAFPLLAMVRTEGFEDWKAKTSLSWVFCEFLAMAKNSCVLPSSTDTFGPGVRETLVGTWFATTRVGAELPQFAASRQAGRRRLSHKPEENFLMNPSTEEWSVPPKNGG